MSQTPQINYFSRDFQTLKSDLTNWAKTYHGDQLQYLSDASPDMMYLEMCSYIGDTLNYYIDKTFNENFRSTAQAKESLLRIASNFAFVNTSAVNSIVEIILTVNVPEIVLDSVSQSDPNYYPTILAGMKLRSTSGVIFEVTDTVNFNSALNRTIVPNLDGNNTVVDYTISKKVIAKAGQSKIQRFLVSDSVYQPFLTITINDTNVSNIEGIVVLIGDQKIAPSDADFADYNKSYYKVKYLAQSTAFFETNIDDTSLVKEGQTYPIPKRYVMKRDTNNNVSVMFGNQSTTSIIQNQSSYTGDVYSSSLFDPIDLGMLPPVNSTVFIKYRVGGGIDTNVAENQITTITSKDFSPESTGLNSATIQKVRSSLTVTNQLTAVGGRDELSIDELREAIGKTYSSQDRGVTPIDIQTLIENMPPQFGQPYRTFYQVNPPQVASLSDVENYVNSLTFKMLNSTTQSDRVMYANQISSYFQNYKLDTTTTDILKYNPNLWLGEKGRIYILSKNEDGYLYTIQKKNGTWISSQDMLKTNIKNYLISKRIIGDWLDIVDGKIINFQIEFSIYADKNNKEQTLIDCLNATKDYFSIKNWYMNQSIYLSNYSTILQELKGVVSVVDVKFYNIIGLGDNSLDPGTNKFYQPLEIGLFFDIIPSTKNSFGNRFQMNSVNNIINCPADSIFELRYPDIDIVGKVL